MSILLFRRTALLLGINCNRDNKLFSLYRAMSDKANTVLTSSDNWFNKYEEVKGGPTGLFKGVSDRFQGITVDSNLEVCEAANFADVLKKSLQFWIENKRRGIWFKVHLDNAPWIPILVNNEFKFHHAKDNFVMMYRWLPETEYVNIPPYAHTMVGVGALVVNEKNEILAVSEKNALIKGSWKLPGGYVEPREDFIEAAIREVLEETGIQTKFDSILSIRHAHGAGFACSDLYIVMSLTPESETINKCEREISKCEWMDVDEFLNHPAVHETNRNFLNTYLKYKKEGIKFDCKEEVHQILKKKYKIYSVEMQSPKL